MRFCTKMFSLHVPFGRLRSLRCNLPGHSCSTPCQTPCQRKTMSVLVMMAVQTYARVPVVGACGRGQVGSSAVQIRAAAVRGRVRARAFRNLPRRTARNCLHRLHPRLHWRQGEGGSVCTLPSPWKNSPLSAIFKQPFNVCNRAAW